MSEGKILNTKPLPVIRNEDREEFLKKFNGNMITAEQRETCKKAGALFKRNSNEKKIKIEAKL